MNMNRLIIIGCALGLISVLALSSITTTPKCDGADVVDIIGEIYKEHNLHMDKMEAFTTISTENGKVKCEAKSFFSRGGSNGDEILDYSAVYDDKKENVIVEIYTTSK